MLDLMSNKQLSMLDLIMEKLAIVDDGPYYKQLYTIPWYGEHSGRMHLRTAKGDVSAGLLRRTFLGEWQARCDGRA